MANDTLQIMQSMDMALRYEGQLVRDNGHVVGIKPNPLSRSVFYAEVLNNDSVAFSIRTDGEIVAHGVIPDLTYDGYDYFAGLLIDIDSGLFNQRKDTKL
jgi:hypothetical protein|nr:MAG TPA: hypothetical protein [Caudoviricetes sp.]